MLLLIAAGINKKKDAHLALLLDVERGTRTANEMQNAMDTSEILLEVVGSECILHPNPPAFADMLIRWPQHDLFLDRFDCRMHLINNHLFDEILKDDNNSNDDEAFAEVEGLEEIELDCLFQERFGDIFKNEERVNDLCSSQRDSVSSVCFPGLPEGCIFPSDHTECLIILHTAKTVREKGEPFEILLKTQLERSEKLSFIESSSKFFPFYQYLRNVDDQLFSNMLSEKFQITTSDLFVNILNYHDDDDITVVKNLHAKQIPSIWFNEVESTPLESIPEDMLDYDSDADKPWGRDNFESTLVHKRKVDDEKQQQKSKRLKAAKLLKGHFLLQSKVFSSKNEPKQIQFRTTPILQGDGKH